MLKIGLISGALFAGLSIVLGAFGAHALKEQLSEYSLGIYEKAVIYQMFHSIGILLMAIIGDIVQNLDVSLSIWFFIFGIVLFSGSLYILAITNIKWLGIITPIGGSLFIAGWIWFIYKIVSL